MKEKWSSAFSGSFFCCGTHCLSRADAVTQLIKSQLYTRASLLELVKLIEDVDNKI